MNKTNEVAELTVKIYTIHEVVLAENGGFKGLRDGAMLHAAIARPFATFGGYELYPSDWAVIASALSFANQKPPLHGWHQADCLRGDDLFSGKARAPDSLKFTQV